MIGTLNKSIYEDGNGGQLLLKSNEIAQTGSLATLAYLLMFGGNVEAETEKENKPGELKDDWWGNDSRLSSDTWINSKTEKVLRGITTTSSSIIKIQSSIKSDLKQLEQFGEITIGVTFPNINRIAINITISEPNKKQDSRLTLVWDASRSEIIEKNIV